MKPGKALLPAGVAHRSMAVAAFGMIAALLVPVRAVADTHSGSAGSTPAAELREICRSGLEPLPAELLSAPEKVIARHDRALAACDRLIGDGGLSGKDLAGALLDRADLLAPGHGPAYARALADYDRAIALDPQGATAFWKRGQAHLLYMRNVRRALSDLDTAIRLDPSRADFFVTRASIQATLGAPDKALADLDHAIALSPTSAKAWSVRGLTHLERGNTAHAIADFDEAIRLAPDSEADYRFRAAARRLAGDEEAATADEAKANTLSVPRPRP